VDATLGDGGHAVALLEATSPDGALIGIDADPQALERAALRLEPFGDRVTLVNDNFSNLETVLEARGFHPVSSVLMDLGLSSWQLESAERGFSFNDVSPLDMRLGPTQEITAADIINTSSEVDLAQILFECGEEPRSRRIAQRIVQRRPIDTAQQLASVVESVIPRRGRRTHPATRTFMAIRIAVNRELDNLESALHQAVRVLARGGRLAVIAYHSLEDRIVKRFMGRESRDCVCPPQQIECACGHRATVKVLTRRVVRPSDEEVQGNPRARSARLRACEALGVSGN
jgi:16S rRNA (cytosine1402-N4)-methyltransferase